MSYILPDAHVSSLRTIHISLDPNRMYTDSDLARTVNDITTKLNPHGMTALELDSHSDTCVGPFMADSGCLRWFANKEFVLFPNAYV